MNQASKRFSEDVRLALTANRVTAKALAAEIGISPATMTRRLGGHASWPIDDAVAVARKFNLSLEGLASRSAA